MYQTGLIHKLKFRKILTKMTYVFLIGDQIIQSGELQSKGNPHGPPAGGWEFGDTSPHEDTAFPYSIVPFRDKYFFVSLELLVVLVSSHSCDCYPL